MNKDTDNILITGGCGFIGSNFVKKILNRNYNIYIIDNLSTGYKENKNQIVKLSKKRIKFSENNLQNFSKIKKIFKKNKFKYIFHFAAFSNVEESLKNPKKFLKNNINSTHNLVKLAIDYKVKYFVFSSSASIYGNIKFGENIKENTKPNPINPYGKSKLKCENIIIENSKKYKFKFIIFRYFNVIGKHASYRVKKLNYLNLFENIKKSILEKKFFEIHGNNLSTSDGTPERDFIHVYDVVSAHFECLKNKKLSFWNNAYNIGYNKGTSVLKIVQQCKKIFGEKLKFKFVKKKRGVIERSIACNIKFKNKSKWKPKYFKIEKLVKSYFCD
tara:strand:+ start:1644 stop:2633 length:990 start_codon:yes stop_codon:yes gene_type:complete